jgi:hypothetical protein
MAENTKITRRTAIARTAMVGIGLTALALVVHNLRGNHETNIPDGTRPFAPSRVTSSGTMTVNGYTLKVPPVTMEIEKPSDWEEYRSLCEKAAKSALDEDPGYQAHLERQQALREETANAESPKKPVLANAEPYLEAQIRRYNKRVDNDDAIDAANKELLKENFRARLKQSYEASSAKTDTP